MTPELIRAWAKSQGIAIGDRGRVAKEIREQYIKAQVVDAATAHLDKPADFMQLVNSKGRVVARQPTAGAPIEHATAPKPRKPRTNIRTTSARIAGSDTTLVTGDPIRVAGTQGHWRFLALVIEPSGSVYVDCVDPGGIGHAISPTRLELPRRGVTADSVRPSLEERQASATAHQPRRAS